MRRGFTLCDLAVTLASLTALVSIATVSTAQDQGQSSTKESVQLRSIHQSMASWASDHRGSLPVPGLIARLPLEFKGSREHIPGRGAEDVTKNVTAALFGMLIMQEYFGPGAAVSPLDRNPKVTVAFEYDFAKYDPAANVYMDPAFAANLETGSNVSYAHVPLFGKRRDRWWRVTTSGSFPQLGNRGPRDGRPEPDSYTTDAKGIWLGGHVVHGDNSVQRIDTMVPPGLVYARGQAKKPDNIFAMQDGPGGVDAVLAFTSAMKKRGPKLQYD